MLPHYITQIRGPSSPPTYFIPVTCYECWC